MDLPNLLDESGEESESGQPLKVMAFDEARFSLINWHRRRYCPKGSRPPYVVRRPYEWTYLYAAAEPSTGESFCSYLPGMDGRCFEAFLQHLGKAYGDHHTSFSCSTTPPATSAKRSPIPRT